MPNEDPYKGRPAYKQRAEAEAIRNKGGGPATIQARDGGIDGVRRSEKEEEVSKRITSENHSQTFGNK